MVRVLGKEKGREMGVAIFVDNLGIGPGSVPATLREEVRAVRDLVSLIHSTHLVRVVRGMVRTGRGQRMVKVVMGKVLGTKVHASTASKLGIRQLSARTHVWLRRSLRWVQVPRFRLVV